MQHPPLVIGAMVFPKVDQLDFTGAFEVLANLPGAQFHVIWKDKTPVRDMRGLILTPTTTLAECPDLDVLVVPGGHGQEDLMDESAVLAFLIHQAAQTRYILSVCTGALLCGAAGLLKGVRATTHWAAFHLLEYYGAIPVNERVVIDGKHVSAAGVTSGIDGALRVAALLQGEAVARRIQLMLEYAPLPPFDGGSPATAAPELVAASRATIAGILETRLATAKRIAARLGVSAPV